MRRLFVSYIRPQLEYACAVWSPLDVASKSRLELVQRRFTKYVTGFFHLSYRERLARLNLDSLEFRRNLLVVCFVHKLLHGMFSVSPASVGLNLCHNNTRSANIKLTVPRPNFTLFKSSFMYRAVVLYNSLPYDILLTRNSSLFKNRVANHWREEGAW